MKKIFNRKFNTALFLLQFVPLLMQAQDEKAKMINFRGYLKDLQSVSFLDDADSILTQNLLHNRFDITLNFSKQLSFRAGLRTRLYYGEQIKLIPRFARLIGIDYGYFDLSHIWIDKKSLALVSNFDRLAFDFAASSFRITAGRQRINWGINTAWNPNDLFNAHNLLDFDYEEKPGADALRIQFFPKMMTAVEIAVSPSRIQHQSIAAALLKFNTWKYDFQVLAGLYKTDIMVGGGWAGNIKDAGFKSEFSYFRNKRNIRQKEDAFTSSISLDYSFKHSWYGMLSVLYTDHPATYYMNNFSFNESGLSAKGLMPYNWSFLAMVSKAFTPIFNGNCQVIYAPDHQSLLFFPALAYNLSENTDLDLTAQCSFRKQPEKYQTTGNSIYLRLKWSF